MINSLRQWWQRQTGEEETPFDGDTPAWVVSMLVHMVALVVLALIPMSMADDSGPPPIRSAVVEPDTEPPRDKPKIEEEAPSDILVPEIGANSERGTEMALGRAPEIAEIAQVPIEPPIELAAVGDLAVPDESIATPQAPTFSKNYVVKGATGQGDTGAVGAIDRITQEILLSLQERKTLVVWLFDQSYSLKRQREKVIERFNRIYKELGVIEAAGDKRFKQHKDKPLLTSVVAFGKNISLRLKQPTDDLEEIKAAVASLEDDPTGEERVFQAVYDSALWFKSYRDPDPETKEPKRNVMFVVFTDEKGDDMGQFNPNAPQQSFRGLENTVAVCRSLQIPVYVVGVPAPFGREKSYVKWVDPDENFDQRPQRAEVTQGPETLMPERLKLHFGGSRFEDDAIDSGFGPFALTRLCYETGGIYFAIHPNRNARREVTWRETAELASHFKYFFDPKVMRRYRPDYVTADEYIRRVSQNKARMALVQAARESWVGGMSRPTLRFVKRSEADLANALTEAQKDAAKLTPKVNRVYEILKEGEEHRKLETTPRWQAGYDLAMGRALAIKVRTEAYNAMLAAAKRGMKFKNAKNNVWILKPTSGVKGVGSQLDKLSQKAEMYLKRVIEEHPGTPWALLAQRELENPIGWEWNEEFQDLTPRRANAGGNNNNAPARNDQKRMIKKGPTRRPPPKL